MDEAEIMNLVPHIVRSCRKRVWIDYDDGADVLYISFVYPPNSALHEEDENGIIRNFDEKGELTGFTIIAAKRFAEGALA
jgi:uncharacterized protein YuzE